jgi:hypothetical protein
VITVAAGGAADNVPPVVLADGDCDGVDDSVENDPANNFGDGNGDTIQDDVQPWVASLLDIVGNYLTVQANTSSHNLENVRVTDGQQLFLWRANPAPLGSTNFPNGFVDFAISNVARGGTAEIKIILPAGYSADRFFLLGPEPEINRPAEHWFNFTHDTLVNDGTVLISGNELTLRFVDGGRGDRDRAPNGVIYIVGAPGEAFALNVPGGGGGGCTLSGFERQPRVAGAWWVLLGLLLVLWGRGRCRSRQ